MTSNQTSDRSLKNYYRIINKKFFNGELPDNVVIRWATAGEEKDVASCSPIDNPDNKNKYLILLNRAKNPTASIKLSALAHEMVHVATQYRDEHGPAFDEWHEKLTQRGLFRKGALLSHVTLF
jgi:hypothetical protein